MGWEWKVGDRVEVGFYSASAPASRRWTVGEIIDLDIRGLPDHAVVGLWLGALTSYDIVKLDELYPAGHHDRRAVEGCRHTVPVSTLEEKCRKCWQAARHKIGDESGPANFHNLTAYVCCSCLRELGMNCDLYPEF